MWIGDREGEAEGEEADLKKGMKDQKSGGRRSGLQVADHCALVSAHASIGPA